MATAETRMPEYPTNTLLPRRIRGKEVRAPTAHERPEFRQTPATHVAQELPAEHGAIGRGPWRVESGPSDVAGAAAYLIHNSPAPHQSLPAQNLGHTGVELWLSSVSDK